jgi:hypothetical protein
MRVGHNHKLGPQRNQNFLWMQTHIYTHFGPFLVPFPGHPLTFTNQIVVIFDKHLE